jgi:hypothetical protein
MTNNAGKAAGGDDVQVFQFMPSQPLVCLLQITACSMNVSLQLRGMLTQCCSQGRPFLPFPAAVQSLTNQQTNKPTC